MLVTLLITFSISMYTMCYIVLVILLITLSISMYTMCYIMLVQRFEPKGRRFKKKFIIISRSSRSRRRSIVTHISHFIYIYLNFKKIQTRPLRFLVVAALFCFCVVVCLSFRYGKKDRQWGGFFRIQASFQNLTPSLRLRHHVPKQVNWILQLLTEGDKSKRAYAGKELELDGRESNVLHPVGYDVCFYI